MAVTGTPAASLRLMPLFHLLLIVFSLMRKAHTSFLSEEGAAEIPPSYEELTASLVVNQLAILQLLQDASNASSVALEKCRQNEAKLENEARAQAARLEEALRLHLERVEEMVQAGQQHSTQVLDAISTKISTIAQDTLTTVPPPPAPTLRCGCDEGWVALSSSCYYINTATLNWAESRDYCLSRDSDLVKVTSGVEDSFIRQQLTESVWIGLTDQDSEGVFVWTDGSRPEYTAWVTGQPDNSQGIEDCGVFWKTKGYGWNDAPCSIKLGAVCEKPVKPVPS